MQCMRRFHLLSAYSLCKQETVESYEEAKAFLTLEMLETAEKGYKVVIEKNGTIFTSTANGDGTYTLSRGARVIDARQTTQQVYSSYIGQWCSDCGKRAGNGENGTCVKKLRDCICSRCGEECKGLECHTCDE